MFRHLFFNYQVRACIFIKKEALAQVFSYKFWEILRTSLFTEHLWAATTVGSICLDSFHPN